ncbi:Phospholipase A2 crotoxin acid subunit CA [Desmophyllum pertusum]|uniref:Phospholipase A2 crotoxin acid subunit CA n=1 Tax=Desmophyllum pertusum TaxID=174260 RepID=A0A9W9YP37_9CNID|nr:Phospholipase A2 crotoxin acid subunit CA [Desmophyllum pertusum]
MEAHTGKVFVLLCTIVFASSASTCYDGYCLNGGTCSVFQGNASCSCPSNFTGDRCQTDVDECQVLSNPCKNGATCSDFFGGYFCRCIYGYEGFDCSINKDDCISLDGNPLCLSGGTCVDRVGKYDCICPPEKTGPVCQFVDECHSIPCYGSASCLTDAFGRHSCFCPRGWTGKNCSIDIDDCVSVNSSLSPCHHGSTCVNTPGSFVCQCVPGYTVYGTKDWEKVSAHCNESAQSPINIETSKVKKDSNLKGLSFTFDNKDGTVSGILINNGHAPTLAIDKAKGTASLTGGPLGDNEYKLQQLHFHFGCKGSKGGSEHTVNCRAYSGELHLVTYNTNYSDFGNAASQDDGLAVIGVFFQIRRKRASRFSSKLKNIRKPENEVAVPELNLLKLVPQLRDLSRTSFYSYKGSLTTPPCYSR